MAIISTQYSPFQINDIVAGNFPLRARTVTIASGSNAVGVPLARGTVLGIVTATGKLTVSTTAASDGSQVPVAILETPEGVDASVGDVIADVYVTGDFRDGMLTYGAGHSATTVNAAMLASHGSIFIQTTPVLG